MFSSSRPPLADWYSNPIIRFLASIRLGVFLMFVALVYASVLSALPWVRAYLEMTEMQAFGHWLFVSAILLLCVSVTLATLTRIRFTVKNLGVLTVHTGILVLCIGSVVYFGTKIEGDVTLRSPRIQVLSTANAGRPVAELLAEPGQSWTTNAPMLGGAIAVRINDLTYDDNNQRLTQAKVVTRIGDAPAKERILIADGADIPIADGRIALRLRTYPAETRFFDREHAALFYRPAGRDWQYVDLIGLPYFRERYLDEGYQLRDTAGVAIPTKRTSPTIRVAGVSVPTGWFEPWRMPLPRTLDEAPFDVVVTGYVPYTSTRAIEHYSEGGGTLNPAVRFRLRVPGGEEQTERTLLADPRRALAPFKTPFEFRLIEDDAQRSTLLRPGVGAHELHIKLVDPPFEQTLAITAGQEIPLGDTGYTLTVSQLLPSWPMMSPGFENADSPAAMIDVVAPDKKYSRTVIQRFPSLSQDIDEQGVRHREGPYDPNLTLHYRSLGNGWVYLLATADDLEAGRITLAQLRADGTVSQELAALDQPVGLPIPGVDLEFALLETLTHARRTQVPLLEPVDQRENTSPHQRSAVRLKFTGKGELAGWEDNQWAFFSVYPHIDAMPVQVETPTGPGGALERWEVVYSRLPHDLGAELWGRKLGVTYFPGRRTVSAWRSDFVALAEGGERPESAVVETNGTYSLGRWTYFQSGAAKDDWSFTTLGVGNRRGIWPMVLGCVLITLGCLYAFYVKPFIQQAQLAAAQEKAAEAKRRREAEAEVVAARTSSAPLEV